MAVGFEHPKAKVHIGDGFQFLNDYKNAFDVIITDSSDPEGPAESLFQKPYFQLMHDALREGGVITTQGCTSPMFALCSSRGGRGFAVRAARRDRLTRRKLSYCCSVELPHLLSVSPLPFFLSSFC